MLELTDTLVAAWARRIQVGDRRLAELDLRLVDLVARYAANPDLRARMPFKGGTALNKLYFEALARLSVDLDHNVIGTKNEVQGARKQIRDHILQLFRDQDPEFELAHDHTWELLRVTGRYQPIAGGAREKIKMEASMVERVPITRIVERPLETHEGTVRIRTYPVDELLATKWRAFYSRSKGRDLYDLATARPMIDDPVLLRKMTLYYFVHAGVEFDPQLLRQSMAEKRDNRAFAEDLKIYLRGDIRFDVKPQLDALERTYKFMFEPDRVDKQFLSLSRHLLGKLGEARAGPLATEEEPLRALFDGHKVQEEFLATSRNDLVPFRKKRPPTR